MMSSIIPNCFDVFGGIVTGVGDPGLDGLNRLVVAALNARAYNSEI